MRSDIFGESRYGKMRDVLNINLGSQRQSLTEESLLGMSAEQLQEAYDKYAIEQSYNPESLDNYKGNGDYKTHLSLKAIQVWLNKKKRSYKPICLEIGPGLGITAFHIKNQGLHCDLMDVSPKACEYLLQNVAGKDEVIPCNAWDTGALASFKSSYDVVLSHSVLQQCVNPAETVQGWISMLRPGGMLIMTVPMGMDPDPYTTYAFEFYDLINIFDQGAQYDDEKAPICKDFKVLRFRSGNDEGPNDSWLVIVEVE